MKAYCGQYNTSSEGGFKFMSNLPDISIELEDSLFDKPDAELTEELYEMARRIAESDRNNEAYREAKKAKTSNLSQLTRSKIGLENELRMLEEELSEKKKREEANLFEKRNRRKFEEVETKCEEAVGQEKQALLSAKQIMSANEKLEKKISALQVEFEIMRKENQHKSNLALKLSQQKEEKMERIRANEDRIEALEDQCEQTKKRAEDLENQLRQEMITQKELDELIKERSLQLEKQQLEREQTSRKQEENKRTINKMITSAKALEAEIELKFKEAAKLAELHDGLRDKILGLEHHQQELQLFVNRRREILKALKVSSAQAKEDERALKSIQKEEFQ